MSNPPKIHQSSVFHSVPPDDVSLRPSGDFLQAELSAMPLHYTAQQGDDYNGVLDWFLQSPFQVTFDYCSERTVKGEKKPGNTCVGADLGNPLNAPYELRTFDPTARVHPLYSQSSRGLLSFSVSWETGKPPVVKNLGSDYLPDILGKSALKLAMALQHYYSEHLTAEGKDSGWAALKDDRDYLSSNRHLSWDKLQQDYQTYLSTYRALESLTKLPSLFEHGDKTIEASYIDPVWAELTSLAATILDDKTSEDDRTKAQQAFQKVLAEKKLTECSAALAVIHPKAKEVGEVTQTAEDFQKAAMRRIGMEPTQEKADGSSLTADDTDINARRLTRRLDVQPSVNYTGKKVVIAAVDELLSALEAANTELTKPEINTQTLQQAQREIAYNADVLQSFLAAVHATERAMKIEAAPRHVLGVKLAGSHSEGIPYPQEELLSTFYGYAHDGFRLRAGLLATEALAREDAPSHLSDDRLQKLSDSNDFPDAAYVFGTVAKQFNAGLIHPDDKIELVGDLRAGGPGSGYDVVAANLLLGGKLTYSAPVNVHHTFGFDVRGYNAENFGPSGKETDLSEAGFQTGVFFRINNPWSHVASQASAGVAGVFPTGQVPREKKVNTERVQQDGKAATQVTTREGRFFAREGGMKLFVQIQPEYEFLPSWSLIGDFSAQANSDIPNFINVGLGVKAAY